MARWKKLSRIYDLYTSDLSYKEVERLIKRDAPEVYDFYLRRMKPLDENSNSFKRTYLLLRNLFIEFLLRLSPVRRIAYTAALLVFIIGYLSGLWNWVFLGFFILNILLAFELADKLTAKDELEIARDLQTSLMPKNAPPVDCFEIACYSEPAREVGGDYYDFLKADKNPDKTYIIVGDISGKGMGAAIRMVQVQTILRFLINLNSELCSVLVALNRHLYSLFKSEGFFTSILAVVGNGSRTIKFCRAGHTPLIHFERSTGECRELIPSGIGIGLNEGGIFSRVLEEKELVTHPGDIIVFYTDGVTEAMDSYKMLYGEERLKNIICSNSHKSAAELKEIIIDSVQSFRGAAIPNDDTTLVVLKSI